MLFLIKIDKFMIGNGWSREKKGITNWQREQMPRMWRGKGGEEDQNCDGFVLKVI